MELQIHKKTTIQHVKDQFSRYFPFLTLEFYTYRQSTENSCLKREVYRGTYLAKASAFFKEGTIYFSSSTSVAELEQELQIELGLAVKVLRKSEGIWTDTTQTAHLSLDKQNNMASLVSKRQFNKHTLFL